MATDGVSGKGSVAAQVKAALGELKVPMKTLERFPDSPKDQQRFLEALQFAHPKHAGVLGILAKHVEMTDAQYWADRLAKGRRDLGWDRD